MKHENEYHDNMVAMLELIWGRGYMAPGGPGNVAKMLDGIETHGKRILDVGCGIGGPVFEMAHTFGAEVVGIDLELPLIERATAAAAAQGLSKQCTFQAVEAGPLLFPDESFDIVVSAGAITQIKDKAAVLGECCRVLRPGGYLSCYDWYRDQASHEYELIKGVLYPSMVELLGQSDADHFVENWRAMVVVIDKGEMRQGYCRGRRPD